MFPHRWALQHGRVYSHLPQHLFPERIRVPVQNALRTGLGEEPGPLLQLSLELLGPPAGIAKEEAKYARALGEQLLERIHRLAEEESWGEQTLLHQAGAVVKDESPLRVHRTSGIHQLPAQPRGHRN